MSWKIRDFSPSFNGPGIPRPVTIIVASPYHALARIAIIAIMWIIAMMQEDDRMSEKLMPFAAEDRVRWVDQSREHDPDAGIYGDCTRAAVASYFALPLEAVPNFNTLDSLEYWREIGAFFHSLGYNLRRFDKGTAFDWPTYILAVGVSPRGHQHMVVLYDGEIAHDPHPSRAGLVKVGGILKVDYALVAIPLDPAALSAGGQAAGVEMPSVGAERVAYLTALRKGGWGVVVRNEYGQAGKHRTSWLFTHPDGRWAQGEGTDDASALADVAHQVLTGPLAALIPFNEKRK